MVASQPHTRTAGKMQPPWQRSASHAVGRVNHGGTGVSGNTRTSQLPAAYSRCQPPARHFGQREACTQPASDIRHSSAERFLSIEILMVPLARPCRTRRVPGMMLLAYSIEDTSISIRPAPLPSPPRGSSSAQRYFRLHGSSSRVSPPARPPSQLLGLVYAGYRVLSHMRPVPTGQRSRSFWPNR